MIYAQYTIVLKTLLDDPQSKALIDKAMSTYPLYVKKSKEEYIPSIVPTREELNKKIINYYKYREIGFETFGRFLDELETALVEIMPRYNQLFFSVDQDYNIVYNADYTRDITTQNDGTDSQNTTTSDNASIVGSESGTNKQEVSGRATSESEGSDSDTTTSSVNSNSKDVNSETPQSQLSITGANIDQVSYADNVKWKKDEGSTNATSNGTTTTSSSGTNEQTSETETSGSRSETRETSGNVTTEGTRSNTETMKEIVKGNYGQVSSQSLVRQYQEIIKNIEQMVINDRRIQELFMGVY